MKINKINFKNLVLSAGLATGLVALVACKDTRTEYSEPIKTNIKISQKYNPQRSSVESELCFDQDMDLKPCLKTVHYHADHITTISSQGCTETIDNQAVYNYFKQNKGICLDPPIFMHRIVSLVAQGDSSAIEDGILRVFLRLS